MTTRNAGEADVKKAAPAASINFGSASKLHT